MSLINDLEQYLAGRGDNAKPGDLFYSWAAFLKVAKSAIALEDFLTKAAGGPDAPVQTKCTGDNSDLYMEQMAELFNNLHDALEKVR